SSDQALAVSDVAPLLQGKAPAEAAPRGKRVVAAAAELAKPEASKEAHGPRVVIAAASNLPWNRSFHDAALLGDRLFVENGVAWVAARPLLVSVPEKSAHDIGLALTEDSLSEVLRYVLIYMPGVAALLGVLVLFERRKREKRSRMAAEGPR
ncbi:MAG TPA: hypothetical protein VGP93_15770, partial [Polyangiaceae bacterium]|nr:hypothetical protein [Polyangiaceae bacterium]